MSIGFDLEKFLKATDMRGPAFPPRGPDEEIERYYRQANEIMDDLPWIEAPAEPEPDIMTAIRDAARSS